MSISTYSELKTAVANYLGRSDLTSYIPDFVTFARQRILYGSKNPVFASEPVRIRGMEASANVSIVAGTRTASLPTRFLGMRRLYLDASPIVELDQVAPDQYWRTYMSTNSGRPKAYCIEGENLTFGPVPDATYTAKALFYQAPSALSSDSDTDWFLTNAPNVWLYASMIEACIYTQEDERVAFFGALYMGAVNALNSTDNIDRYGRNPLVVRTDIGNP